MAAVWNSRCAFIRLFIRKTSQIPNISTVLGAKLPPESQSISATRYYSRFMTSPLVSDIQEKYEYEISKNPVEWEYVMRLLPFDTIPAVTPKDNYPSGWIPPREEAKNLPYFLTRTRTHELPIYLNITYRGMRKISTIKKIDGDIWLMNEEIQSMLSQKYNKHIATRVHELATTIEVKGDFVNDLRNWAYSKGF